jgi:hypothetical protein
VLPLHRASPSPGAPLPAPPSLPLGDSHRNFEIRSAEEIDDQLRALREESAVGSGGVGSASAAISHAKPSRPGKGKTRISKFKADEDS